MNASEIRDVLILGDILEHPAHGPTPDGKAMLIGALLDWKNQGEDASVTQALDAAAGPTLYGKPVTDDEAEPYHEDDPDSAAQPDDEPEPEPVAAPAKKAPAKAPAKSRAKPPATKTAPPADDDDEF